jgi:hypothetical protein
MFQTLSHRLSGPNYPRNAASAFRTTTDLALLIYKGKQAYIKIKSL